MERASSTSSASSLRTGIIMQRAHQDIKTPCMATLMSVKKSLGSLFHQGQQYLGSDTLNTHPHSFCESENLSNCSTNPTRFCSNSRFCQPSPLALFRRLHMHPGQRRAVVVKDLHQQHRHAKRITQTIIVVTIITT